MRAISIAILLLLACGGSETQSPGGSSGGANGVDGSAGAGGSTGSSGAPGSVGTGGSSSVVTTTGPGPFPCRDAGGGGFAGSGGASNGGSCSRPVCSGDASACPQPNAFCDNGLCCATGPDGSPVCLECTCDGECSAGSPFCRFGACSGCRSSCDCPAGKTCQQTGFTGAITFGCR